jgi:hypothetical protein
MYLGVMKPQMEDGGLKKWRMGRWGDEGGRKKKDELGEEGVYIG